MIYKQNIIPNAQQFTGHDLVISGTKLSRDIDWPSIMTKFNNRKPSILSTARMQKAAPHRIEFETGLTFKNLINSLRMNNESNSYTQSPLLPTIRPSNQKTKEVNKTRQEVNKYTRQQ